MTIPREIALRIIYSYRKRAERIGIEYDLTQEELISIVSKPCFYCGSMPSNSMASRKKVRYYYSGMDRVNPNFGYVIDNVLPCCKWCNSAKLQRSMPEFFEWANRLHAHLKEKRLPLGETENVTEES